MLGFKQVEVSSANFVYGASLGILATAYLAGITSINGAIVGGMLISAGAFVPTFSNYMFAGTNIDSYIGALTGLGIIVTAIVHPEGIAPFFGDGVRHAGNWLVGADSRRRTRSDPSIAALGRRGQGVHGRARGRHSVLPLQRQVHRERLPLGARSRAVLVWVIIVIAAVVLGGINPTFGEAGMAWIGWAKRFGPTALVGYVLGWLIWPLRVDTYSKLWMPLVGAVARVVHPFDRPTDPRLCREGSRRCRRRRYRTTHRNRVPNHHSRG